VNIYSVTKTFLFMKGVITCIFVDTTLGAAIISYFPKSMVVPGSGTFGGERKKKTHRIRMGNKRCCDTFWSNNHCSRNNCLERIDTAGDVTRMKKTINALH
jgi:hypothetical protein